MAYVLCFTIIHIPWITPILRLDWITSDPVNNPVRVFPDNDALYLIHSYYRTFCINTAGNRPVIVIFLPHLCNCM